MRAEKAKKFKELQAKKGTRDYEEWFLNYKPETVKRKAKEPVNNDENKEKTTVKSKTRKHQAKPKNKSKSKKSKKNKLSFS
jgi:hypothetical protein